MFPRRFFQKSTRVSSAVAEPDVSPEVSAATTTATTTSPEGQDEDVRGKEVEKGIGRDQVCSLFSSAVFCVCVRLRARDLKSDLSTSLDLTRYQSTRHRPPRRQTATACTGRFVLDSFGDLNAGDGIRIQFRLS